MKLNYSILWFDDYEEYFDSLDLTPLEQDIESWGFKPSITKVMTPEDFMRHAPFTAYDLIVIDRNLETYADGQDFIERVRSNAVYTEVIFYTAGNVSELWVAIRDKELEGVFVSSRANIVTKITKVGRQSVRKVLDLDNMRGIVMAEVGELDLLFDRILSLGMESLPDESKNAIFKKFHKSVQEQLNAQSAKLEEFIQNPALHVMVELCDSYKRWMNFNRLLKLHTRLKALNNLGNYNNEVLDPRNFLAHGYPELLEEGGYVFRYREKEYVFNETTSLELRKTILGYKNSLLGLIETLHSEEAT